MPEQDQDELQNVSHHHRWPVLAAGILIQLCLGVIFAWSAFASPLTRTPYDFTRLETQIIFSCGLAMFALSMAFAAQRVKDRLGSRGAMLAGGLVLAAGYGLAGMSGNHFWGLFIGTGFLAGLGIGLAYVHPIAILVQWFPDKKGLITGVAVAGFGFGALLWILLTGGFKLGEWVNLSPGWDGLYGDGWSVNEVFKLYGVIFTVLIPLGTWFMKEAPAGWGAAVNSTDGAAIDRVELTVGQMVHTRQFWILLCGYAAGTMSGLMVIGNIKLFGVDSLTASGVDAVKAASIANTAMGFCYAIMNAMGRIIWGAVSDRIGRKRSIVLMSGMQGLMMLALYWLGQNELGLYIAATLIGFNFGGNFALFFASTADYFGPKHVGANYPRVFLGYGVGGILGPLLGGWMGDHKFWLAAFIPCGVVLLAAAALTTQLKQLTGASRK